MIRIKRVKDGAIAYVTQVAPDGSVARLSPKSAEAAAFTDGVAARVKEFYSKRPEFGQLEYGAVTATAEDLARANAAEAAAEEGAFRTLQEEVSRLAAENEALRKDLAESDRNVKALTLSLDDANKNHESQRNELARAIDGKEAEIAALKGKHDKADHKDHGQKNAHK